SEAVVGRRGGRPQARPPLDAETVAGGLRLSRAERGKTRREACVGGASTSILVRIRNGNGATDEHPHFGCHTDDDLNADPQRRRRLQPPLTAVRPSQYGRDPTTRHRVKGGTLVI